MWELLDPITAIAVSVEETRLGRKLTSEEYRTIFKKNFNAILNASVKRDIAVAEAYQANEPPIWIKPLFCAIVVFVVVLVLMVSL